MGCSRRWAAAIVLFSQYVGPFGCGGSGRTAPTHDASATTQSDASSVDTSDGGEPASPAEDASMAVVARDAGPLAPRGHGPYACVVDGAVPFDAGSSAEAPWSASLRGEPFVRNDLGWAMAHEVMIWDIAVSDGGAVIASGVGPDVTEIGGHAVDAGRDGIAMLWRVSDAGEVSWVKPLGSTRYAEPLALAVGEGGRLFTAEHRPDEVSAECDIGMRTFGVAGFTASGERTWEAAYAARCGFVFADIAAHPGGTVAFTVAFDGTAEVDGASHVANAGDALVVAHDSDGAVRWSAVVGGDGEQSPSEIMMFPDGDVLLVGTLVGEISVGAFHETARGFGNANLFLARLRGDDGTLAWAKRIDGEYHVREARAAMDGHGRFTVTGEYSGYLLLDGECFDTSGHDGFVLSFDGDGALRWAETYDESFLGAAYVSASPRDDRVALTLSFNEPIPLGDEILYPASETDSWLWQLDANGTHLAAARFVGPGSDWPRALAFGPDGALWMAGTTTTFMELPVGDVLGQRYLARFTTPDALE